MKPSHRRHHMAFNPFIVLSDVTISTLVVMTCLAMYFAGQTSDLGKQNDDLKAQVQLLENEQQERIQAIRGRQDELAKGIKEAARDRAWPKDFGLSMARGDSTFLLRFFDEGLFEGARISAKGQTALALVARHLGPRLRQQAESNSNKAGVLIEVQVRGHCSARPGVDGWDLSLRRAREAVRVMDASLGPAQFPECLFSIAGLSSHRPAYKSTLDSVQTARKRLGLPPSTSNQEALRLLRELGEKKALLADRLDILVLYSGGEKQNNYVQAVDQDAVHYGPRNDSSTPELWDLVPETR